MTELAEGMAERGHEVRVVTAMPWYPANAIAPEYRGKIYFTEQRNGVTIQRCFVWTGKDRRFRERALFELSFVVLSFGQALRGWRPDVILLTVPGLPVAIPAVILSKFFRCPLVLNLQDILPDAAVHVGLMRNPKVIALFEGLERFAYHHATKISVIADGFTQNLAKKGVNLQKVVQISNWVDVDFIRPLPQVNNYFRLAHNLEGKFVVLYSGNIALTQPLETLIDAAEQLQDYPDIAIVIVGKKQALDRLASYYQTRNANNVLLLPFQPREKLPEMLAAADASVVVQKSNVISFNMPSKIQVLLASGRPILASVPKTGTAAKAIAASGGGLVIPPEDSAALAQAILQLYQNPEQVKILGDKGRAYAQQHYSFARALDSYERLFSELI
jgi:colanic acid biosynthesis glycosyl transferase WcaI